MDKIAVVYWSGTGNTEAMASAVADGIKEAGAEAVVMTSAECVTIGQLKSKGEKYYNLVTATETAAV